MVDSHLSNNYDFHSFAIRRSWVVSTEFNLRRENVDLLERCLSKQKAKISHIFKRIVQLGTRPASKVAAAEGINTTYPAVLGGSPTLLNP